MKTRVAAIVGRFQVPELHPGHKDLINYALANFDQVLIILGTPLSRATEINPLPYAIRESMIKSFNRNLQVVELRDCPSDKIWSESLDHLIVERYPDAQVTLLGSRDSFFGVYSGKLSTEYLEPKNVCNGTACRDRVSVSAGNSKEFRAGIIYREQTRRPVAYPTIDIAVLRNDQHYPNSVLLAGKPGCTHGMFFIGGFVDAEDCSLEQAARREVCEETGMETADLRYIGSHKVDDLRYRRSKDGIITSFFRATYIFGALTPKDDINRLEWVLLTEMVSRLAPEHKPLGEMLLRSLS